MSSPPTDWPYRVPPEAPAAQVGDGLWRMEPPSAGGPVFLVSLASAAFPDPHQPGAAVIVPPAFRPEAPLDVLLYLHGFSNCVQSVVTDTGLECRPGSGHRCGPSKLRTQLHASGRGALLIVPALKVDQRTGACGALTRPGGFRALLDEVLAKVMPALGAPAATAEAVARTGVMGHSGGYTPVARAIDRGHLPNLREVVLLDALYGEAGVFARWVTSQAASLGTASAPGPVRFACVYTDGGGTKANATSLARLLGSSLPAGALRHDTTTGTLGPADYAQPVLFKRSGLSHGDVSRYYPEHFWRASAPR